MKMKKLLTFLVVLTTFATFANAKAIERNGENSYSLGIGSLRYYNLQLIYELGTNIHKITPLDNSFLDYSLWWLAANSCKQLIQTITDDK